MNKVTLMLLISSLFISPQLIAKQVGEIKYARGAVTVQQQDGSGARLVGKGNPIAEGEVIKTGNRSFAIISLADNTRMTLRPGTSFAVEQMNAKKDSSANAILRLFKGGLRAITGFISKNNPDGYRLRTSVATIGIRGTEFDARICDTDCAEENKKLEDKQQKESARVVGRVAYKRGSLDAQDIYGNERALKSSANLFEGDTLTTGDRSYAVIVFKDKSRVSLQANSVFRIDELSFKQKEPEKASGFFSLLKGGLRAVSGLIGKFKPDAYQMRTSVATIGIRGTGYDLLCTGACIAASVTAAPAPATSNPPQGPGLYANVWQGSITMGATVVFAGKAAFIKNLNIPAVILPIVPDVFKKNTVPKPNTIEVEDTGFADAPPGLYVSVTDGEVTLQSDSNNQKTTIGKGQAAFAAPKGAMVKPLARIPAFQKFDAYPTPKSFKPKAARIGGGAIGTDTKDLNCEIN